MHARQDGRERLRAVRQWLIAAGGGCVAAIGPSIAGHIAARQDGDFGCSLRAFLLYAQWGDAQDREPGLVIADDNVLFAVGLYLRADGLHLHIVCPKGTRCAARVLDLARAVLRDGLVDRVYVRHLTRGAERELQAAQFVPVERYPWLPESPAEDETFSHRVVNLPELLPEGLGSLQNPRPGPQPPGRRPRALRLAYHRFASFLRRNGATLELLPMAAEDYRHAAGIVREHFRYIAKTPAIADCDVLLRFWLPDDETYLSLIGWLQTASARRPVCIFLGEQSGPASGAVYLNLARRDPRLFAELGIHDLRGFSAISAYAHAQLFAAALARGWRVLDLGGSETRSLDRFKQTIGATPLQSRWVVMTREEL